MARGDGLDGIPIGSAAAGSILRNVTADDTALGLIGTPPSDRFATRGAAWWQYRVYFNVASLAALKSCTIDLWGYQGDLAQRALQLATLTISLSNTDAELMTVHPVTGVAETNWYEATGAAQDSNAGIALFFSAPGSVAKGQAPFYVSTLDCGAIAARIRALSSGIGRVILVGKPSGAPLVSES